MIPLLVYVCGIFLFFLFLNKYGEKIRVNNYSQVYEEDWYGDYEPKQRTYIIISIFWPPVLSLFVITVCFNLVFKFFKYLKDASNRSNI